MTKYPPSHVLNPAFVYTPAAATNAEYLREKFARIRAAQVQEPAKVTQIKRRNA